MANKNLISIGGIKFNKNDIKESKIIEKDGQKLNSVFLKDGTNIEFPNQSAKNDSEISQKNGKKTEYSYHYGYSFTKGEYCLHYGPKEVEDPDKKITEFNRISKAKITGTDNADIYNLNGCADSTVDLSKEDNKVDLVNVLNGSKHEGSIFNGTETKYKSSDNKVNLGKGDQADMIKKEGGFLGTKKYKTEIGPKIAEEPKH